MATKEQKQIERWMKSHRLDHIDPQTGELIIGELAEACALALGHDEWLDDSMHDVWDIACRAEEL